MNRGRARRRAEADAYGGRCAVAVPPSEVGARPLRGGSSCSALDAPLRGHVQMTPRQNPYALVGHSSRE